MDDRLVEIVEAADWTRLTPQMEHYADIVMRRYIWRGLRVSASWQARLLVDGKSADDFVKEAVHALLFGDRTYDYGLSLEQNIRRTIESSIWNWKKKSDRRPLLDHASADAGDTDEFDPIEAAADPGTARSTAAEKNERQEAQRKVLEDFRATLQGDDELRELFESFESGYHKPAEIEELTTIPAARVYELKRKVEGKFLKFLRDHPSAEAADIKKTTI